MTDQINKELNKKYKTNKVHLYCSSRLRQQLSHQPTNSCRAEPWCCVGPERRERSTVSSVNLTRRQFGCGSAVLGVKDEQKRRKDTALWGASGGIVSERILLTNTLWPVAEKVNNSQWVEEETSFEFLCQDVRLPGVGCWQVCKQKPGPEFEALMKGV